MRSVKKTAWVPVVHLLRGLPVMGTRKWLRYYSNGTTSTPTKSDDYGRTPFWGAVLNGHEGVVEILLGRNDVNPDAQDIDGRTPLCCAAQNGHEGFVKMLLERDDVNFNKADDYGRTPLHYAIMEGHIGVVNILFATMVRHSRSRVSDAGRERSIVYS